MTSLYLNALDFYRTGQHYFENVNIGPIGNMDLHRPDRVTGPRAPHRIPPFHVVIELSPVNLRKDHRIRCKYAVNIIKDTDRYLVAHLLRLVSSLAQRLVSSVPSES